MLTKEIIDSYEPTIGIECHVQFKTKTKLFSGADNDDRDKAPNTAVSPICFGLPGTLPVLNEKAVELAVRAGHALKAKIAPTSSFDRKHYFYPDLPKGYQITQLDRPIVLAGHIDAPMADGSTVRVRIHHAHLEEDAGKSTHPAGADYSLVDLNRAGTPLLEIVSEADMHSAAEAKAYAQELYLLMKYAGVTHGDLSRGNMRFDVNVSVAKKGAKEWGTRTETKNLNSFRAVERAVEYEVKRQIELIEKGETIKQETRGWIEATQKTVSQRSKEDAMDYRYFPEPDVPPIELSDDYIEEVKKEMPKLPADLRAEIIVKGVSAEIAETLILQDALSNLGYVDAVLGVSRDTGDDAARFVANFLANRDIKHRAERKEQHGAEDAGNVPTIKQFSDVYKMFKASDISSTSADNLLFNLRLDASQDAREWAEKHGYIQENDTAALEAIIAKVLADPASAKAAADVKAGEAKAIGYLVGQVMKQSQGKANPSVASDLIRKQLGV
jgi:aspartyl-tRNA(Asn)/glutamyl-tRNA(Gln) amidotransferase subunit B